MDIKKFERAKEIESLDLAIGMIKDCITRGKIHVLSNPYNISGVNDMTIAVPDELANRIYDAISEYQNELIEEFEQL